MFFEYLEVLPVGEICVTEKFPFKFKGDFPLRLTVPSFRIRLSTEVINTEKSCLVEVKELTPLVSLSFFNFPAFSVSSCSG